MKYMKLIMIACAVLSAAVVHSASVTSRWTRTEIDAGIGIAYSNQTAKLDTVGGTASNLTVYGMTFGGPVTGLIQQIFLEEQTEDQRALYVGGTNELVRNTSTDKFPLTVFDGVSTGGVPIVGYDGAILNTGLENTTNTVDWSGWTTTGIVTNGNLVLTEDDYLSSPQLTDGIAFYTDAISTTGGAAYAVTVYTNSISTPVALPYYGTDARLRVDYMAAAGVPGETPAVMVPNTNGIIITGYERVDVLQSENVWVRPFKIITEAVDSQDVARKSTVDTAYTNAITYADAGISAYQSDATKRLRGAEVFTPGWNVITESTITNRTYELSAGGLTVFTYEVILGGLTNKNMELTATNVTFRVVTNNVVNKPFVEFSADLEIDEWQPVVETSNSYPAAEEYIVYGWVGTNYVATATNTGYTIVCDLPDDDAGYFRVLNKTADSSMTVESDVIRFENLPTSTNGLPSAALWSDSGTLKVMP